MTLRQAHDYLSGPLWQFLLRRNDAVSDLDLEALRIALNVLEDVLNGDRGESKEVVMKVK